MKSVISFSIYIISVFIFCACANHNNADEPQIPSDELKTCKIIMDVQKPIFNDKEDSRSISQWEEGDIVYLRLEGISSYVTGNAVYKNSEWTFNYSGTLKEDLETAVFGIYIENDYIDNNDVLSFNNISAVYECKNGTYKFTNDPDLGDKLLTVKMILSPKTGRIRFKSEKQTDFIINGITYNTGLNLKTWEFIESSESLTAIIGNDNWSPYYYCSLSNNGNSTLSLSYTYMDDNGKDEISLNFKTDFQNSRLQPGKSGWVNLPTTTNSKGWTMELKVTRNGNEYIDLGLPSGLLWASCNVGASAAKDYGNYFAWGETSTKSDYSPATSTTYGKPLDQLETSGIIDSDSHLMPEYDAATKNCGIYWRMPTYEDFKELMDNCTKEWITQNGINGCKIIGPNKNFIFLPAAGIMNGEVPKYQTLSGRYWSSTPFNEWAIHILYFKEGTNEIDFTVSRSDNYFGLSVRPVSDP